MSRTNRILLAGVIAIILASMAMAWAEAREPRLPNVVFFMADDIGLGDIGFYHEERTGGDKEVQTPNIDELIKEGMRFSDAHTPAGLCAPTRYCTMTGSYTYRCHLPLGVWGSFEKSAIQPGQKTVGQVMQDAGYHTAFFGKWHMSCEWYRKGSKEIFRDNKNDTGGKADIRQVAGKGPNDFGFDYSYMLPKGIQGNPYAYYENGKWDPIAEDSFFKKIRPEQHLYERYASGTGDSNWDPKLAGPRLSGKAVAFVREHARNAPSRPFFMYYCSQAVHLPHTPPEVFAGIAVRGRTSSPHADMIYEMDLQVGALMEALKRNDLCADTLFIFTSDNGGLNREQSKGSPKHQPSNGYRGSKGHIYEGGHRVPFIASWPGRIKAGVDSSEVVMTQDLMATLYALTGQSMPNDQGMDSFNLLPLLLGEEGAKGREMMLLQAGNRPDKQGAAIRQGDWKLIMTYERANIAKETAKAFGLFNLRDNPFEDESENLIDHPEHQERAKEMFSLYWKIRTEKARTCDRVN